MTEARQVWLRPEHIGGQDPQVGQWYALTEECSDFALRKWDGTRPFAVGQVVAIVELRSYGGALAQEVGAPTGVLRAMSELASDGLFEVREAPARPAHGPIDPATLHAVGTGEASTACGIVGGSHTHPALRITFNPDLVKCPVCKPPEQEPCPCCGTLLDPEQHPYK